MFPPDLSFHCGWWRQSWCNETQLEAQCDTSRLVARDIRVSFGLAAPPPSRPSSDSLSRGQLPLAAGWAHVLRVCNVLPSPWPVRLQAWDLITSPPPAPRGKALRLSAQFWVGTTLIASFYSLFVCVCWQGGRVWSSITVLEERFKLCKSSYLAHREKSPKSTQMWFSSRVLG